MPTGIYFHKKRGKIIKTRRIENKICKCGCNRIIPFYKSHEYFMPDYIKGHGRKGRQNSLEHNQAIIEKNRTGHKVRCKYCHRFYYAQVCEIKKGKKYCSKNCYTLDMKGKSPPKETMEKLRKSNIGHIVTKETRDKISFANSGEGNGQWKEITIEKIKHSVRIRDNFLCMLCGLHQEKNKGKSLDVHHIDYNKENSILQNLISLCHKCHAGTNKSKRKYWIRHFHSILSERYKYKYLKNGDILLKIKS